MLEDGGGQVGAPHGLAAGSSTLDLGVIERQPELLQPLGHALDPQLAIGPKGFEPRAKPGVAMVDAVPEHMDVGALDARNRRELDGGHDVDAALRSRRQRRVDAVHRVVVGQGEQAHARGRGSGHHVGWRPLAVRAGGMGLQVEVRRRHCFRG